MTAQSCATCEHAELHPHPPLHYPEMLVCGWLRSLHDAPHWAADYAANTLPVDGDDCPAYEERT